MLNTTTVQCSTESGTAVQQYGKQKMLVLRVEVRPMKALHATTVQSALGRGVHRCRSGLDDTENARLLYIVITTDYY